MALQLVDSAKDAALTFGYMMYGALTTLHKTKPEDRIYWLEKHEGELGVAMLFLDYAWYLESLWEKGNAEGKSAQGVWDYEISEPFGVWFIENDPTHEEALAWLDRAAKEQFE